ncbi:hypothetical protein [Altererythrobacter sp. GH1-8]|uniref:hypothetical protein n=1 Tax=Altererythrobacter sp. GH1-8 TaxID=3349333 RepID=UPI00374D7178
MAEEIGTPDSPSQADKTTIGMTASMSPKLKRLEEDGQFKTELDAAKFALAYAIRQNVGQGRAESPGTKWNRGTLDEDGALRTLVQTIYPGETQPYRQIEFLINEGVRLLVADENFGPDILELIQFSDA